MTLKEKRKKVVVVGSGGRLGSSLVRFLRHDHEVTALGRDQLDLGCSRSIDEALGGLDFDQIVLAGALTGVDYCETHEDEAFAVNADGPGRISEISAKKGAHVTYISTDMVFDGAKADPYVESDVAYPVNIYGASKLAGEARVLGVSSDNLVVRISWVFGPGRPAFPEWIINRACSEANLTLPGDKICCPTSTLDLISYLDALVFNRASEPASGIVHLCNSDPCTWLEWGQFCIDTARNAGLPVIASKIKGVPVDSVREFVAKRPVNSAMSTRKFTELTGIEPRCWQSSVYDFLTQSELFKKFESSGNIV